MISLFDRLLPITGTAAILLLGLAPDAAPGAPQEPFVDVANEVNLEFMHEPGLTGAFLLPEVMGSGAALFDYDGDGDLDVYLVNGGSATEGDADGRPSNRLFRQEQGGSFIDLTELAGVGDRQFGMGTAVGDMDRDGDLDLFVSNYGANVLYRNDGDGSFSDVTQRLGVASSGWSTSAAFVDFDRDRRLDLYVVRYVEFDDSVECRTLSGRREYCGPDTFAGQHDLLYRNLGDSGFVEIGAETGIGGQASKGLGLIATDLTDDGLPDFYVANDGEPNQLWVALGDGRFEDEGIVSGAALNLLGESEAGMGIAVGDVDGDGDLDLFVTHLDRETNTLYTNRGDGTFGDDPAAGLGPGSLASTGFGTGFFDYDLDGDLDVMIAGGTVHLMGRGNPSPRTVPGSIGDVDAGSSQLSRVPHSLAAYAEPDLLFENQGDGRFRDVSAGAGGPFASAAVSRGLLVGDIDRDGDLDVLISNADGPARLLRNGLAGSNGWLQVRALEAGCLSDALGAQVRVLSAESVQMRPVLHTYSYLSSGDATSHFGLGDSTLRQIEVSWPGGGRTIVHRPPSNRFLALCRESDG